MKFFCNPFLPFLTCSLLVLFFASDHKSRSTSATMPPPAEGTSIETATSETSTPITPAVTGSSTTGNSEQPVPIKSLPTKKGYPYALKTKWSGLVKSPYAQDKIPVDVSGFVSGSFARCPHTGKIFVVP